MTKKKMIIIAIIVIIVVAAIILFVRNRNKKKKQTELAFKPVAQTPIQNVTQTVSPKMTVVPKEDRVTETAPEAPLSVEQVIPETKQKAENKQPTGAPGTLGVPVVNNGTKPAEKAQAKSSALPSEFMIDANNPNAQV